MGLYTRHFCLSEKEMSRSIIYRFQKPSNNELTTSAHKTEDVNRTKNIWFSPFVFTGKEKDSETGFYYFGGRYYDPAFSGLFISVDPMADKYPSISPYAYCTWNPVKLVDPEGEEYIVTLIKGFANATC